jgi:hypothetical protein
VVRESSGRHQQDALLVVRSPRERNFAARVQRAKAEHPPDAASVLTVFLTTWTTVIEFIA